MENSQLIVEDKLGRPYYLMGSYVDDEAGIPGEVLAMMIKAKAAKSETRPCIYFQNGNCRFGHHCRFVHDHNQPQQADDNNQCMFYQRGNCRYGDECRFRHGDADDDVMSTKSQVNTSSTVSKFSASDEDLKVGRLTRLRMYLDVPIDGSVKNPHPECHGEFYIEVFVNKREDNIQYLYDVVEKANHPFYQPDTFELSQPGTNCDLSDKSVKLKDTLLFETGSCVEVLLKKS
eukprot:gene9810-10816_t